MKLTEKGEWEKEYTYPTIEHDGAMWIRVTDHLNLTTADHDRLVKEVEAKRATDDGYNQALEDVINLIKGDDR